MSKVWRVYWNEYSFGTYLYGSKIQFHSKNDVEFENALMPPGVVIKEWYSKLNYQMMRTEPSLPMIDGESEYHIKVNMDPFDTFIVQMAFYDRYDNEAGTLIIREPEMDFKCPLKTYSYRIQLINAGGKSLHFHSFEITEKK
jgi:accessory secretory protein Asp3